MSNGITRRELLGLALASPFAAALSSKGLARDEKRGTLDRKLVANSPGRVVGEDGAQSPAQVRLVREWRGTICRSRVVNGGREGVRLKEVVLFDIAHRLPPETRLYGEGFQMLSQTAGTLGRPFNLSQYTDAGHYKLPAPAGARVFYGMMTLAPPHDNQHLLAFTSCRRFAGQFYSRDESLQVVLDTEGLELRPGESWELEEFTYDTGPERAQLLARLAERLAVNHTPLRTSAPPTGWCSWYCFGPRVTARQVLDNLDFIAKNVPGLKYVQIDDGYQPAMGDWLETGAAFGGDVRGVLREIRARGFEPAIWVAPFVAEEKSNVFREHTDWFVKDEDGSPLRSDKVSFGGWRRGPWYVLDGTHTEVQKHFENLFGTMRREWGVRYFKLDANFWGAIHGGRHFDARATRVEAYRRGMHAILRGAGDGFVLGCNHPLWPSLGLIHGSRSSNDIKRSWDRFASTARQNLSRNWQNGRLWWNDPDAVVLTGDLAAEEFQFHATAVYASGGMVLSGDDLTVIPAERLSMLRKLLPPTRAAADFDDDTLRVGIVNRSGSRAVCLFNWSDAPQSIAFRLPAACHVSDYWSGEDLGRHEGSLTLNDIRPHSARLLVVSPELTNAK